MKAGEGPCAHFQYGMFSHFLNAAERGMPPCCHVFGSFLTQWEGVCPSSLGLCHFDVTRRVYPSLSCYSNFNTVRGMPPSHCVFVSSSMHWGGIYLFLLCFCHFDVTRRGIPSALCLFHFNMVWKGMSPLCHIIPLFLTC